MCEDRVNVIDISKLNKYNIRVGDKVICNSIYSYYTEKAIGTVTYINSDHGWCNIEVEEVIVKNLGTTHIDIRKMKNHYHESFSFTDVIPYEEYVEESIAS